MNDAHEMRWGYKVFEDAATEILTNALPESLAGLDKDFIDRIDSVISPMGLQVQPFIASFSKEPDQLSQWRGYADDGQGFAIGFSGTALQALPVTLLEVLYDHKQQILEMKRAIAAIYLRYADASSEFGSECAEDCVLLGAYLAALKNPSFHEEREVRALHLVNVKHSERAMRLVPNDSEIEIQFRASSGTLTAYLDLRGPGDLQMIKEVVMGPKNPNAPGNVLFIAGQYGHNDLVVKRSAGSYR